MMKFIVYTGAVATAFILTLLIVLVPDWERPPLEVREFGPPGLGLIDYDNPRIVQPAGYTNVVPEPLPMFEPVGVPSSEIYENVQVLGDVDAGHFTRLMQAMTGWVVGDEAACEYCHNLDNLASDEKYTKVVARQMLRMTRWINEDWDVHVQPSGVTCYTCHRGKPVPQAIWFKDPPDPTLGIVGQPQKFDVNADTVRGFFYNSVFEKWLLNSDPIVGVSQTVLPTTNLPPWSQSDDIYVLMMQMSNALGVNCTYCHNSRIFNDWEQSPPARRQAWYGIRMVRGANTDHIVPLTDVFPPIRKGPMGDPGKVQCLTCHYGIPKPLNGANLIQHYPSLDPDGPMLEIPALTGGIPVTADTQPVRTGG